MTTIRLLLTGDHLLGASMAACLSRIGQASGPGGGHRQEGLDQGGCVPELLPVWKVREVFAVSRTIPSLRERGRSLVMVGDHLHARRPQGLKGGQRGPLNTQNAQVKVQRKDNGVFF